MQKYFKDKTGGASTEKQKFVNLNESTDLEGQTIKLTDDNARAPKYAMDEVQQTAANKPKESSGGIGSKLASAKAFVLGRSEPEPQGALSVFNCLPADKNLVHAGIAFLLCGFFTFLSILMLGTIVAAPDKFVTCYSISIFCLIAALASMSGPRPYIKNLFRNKNLYATIVLLTCMVLSLYFSMIEKAYLMSLLMSIIEMNAVMYFFCGTAAVNLDTIKFMFKAFWMAISGMFNAATRRGI
jgi:hypothetical protein